jgi:hypothetical protein
MDYWFIRKMALKAVGCYMDDPRRESGVIRLGGVFSNICVKFGNTVQLSEAAALRLVRKKASIPVPKVYCAFQVGVVKYIVMDSWSISMERR